MTHLSGSTFLAAAAVTLLAACGRPPSAPQAAGTSAAAAQLAAALPAQGALERGRKLFAAECAGCHGERGRGDGPAAQHLPVLPRDFTREKFKFRTTLNTQAPTRRDIFDTITAGLGGTGMPSFTFLSEAERWDLVEAVRWFARIDRLPEPQPVALGPEPPADDGSVARGRQAFEKHECFTCHGPEGHGDGPSAKDLKDSLERPIRPRDYSQGLRLGGSVAAVHAHIRTGLAGTPMADHTRMTLQEGWDVARYVLSLKAPAAPLPADPVERGRAVVATRHCNACHVIEGKGGRVGPSLDVSAQKLRYAWAKEFLKDPRPHGKVYPYIPYRMANLGLSEQEIDGVLSLFAHVAGRTYPETVTALTKLDAAPQDEGMLLYFLRCTECHNLGNVVPTPEAKRQGPDLINVAARVRPEWISKWIADPRAIYPDTRMIDTELDDRQIEAVKTFVWNTSVDNLAKRP